MKNNNFSVSLALNAWPMSRNTFIPMSSHAVSLSADIEHALVQKKILKQVFILRNSFQFIFTFIFITFFYGTLLFLA